MSELALAAKNLTKDYQDGARTLHVLRGLHLEVRPGEIVSITGASGSGKSTLLSLLAGLDRPSGGSIRFADRELSKLSEGELSNLRAREIGIVFQFYHLLPEFSALENLLIPQLIVGAGRRSAREKARAALAEVGLADREHQKPFRMSGGEQQRVAIARALINEPKLVLADEPTGNLDAETGDAIIQLLWERVQRHKATLIIVTHEPPIAAKAGRHLELTKGKLELR